MRAAVALLLWAATAASAHRLDEYLQATMFLVEKDCVQAQMSLTPGVAVFPFVLAGIDTDTDGQLSGAEKRAYADRVLHDVSLTVDGKLLPLRLVSVKFAEIEELKQGRGEIGIEFRADVPQGGEKHTLVFENRHQHGIAAYLVNCLRPREAGFQVIAQRRDYRQSHYELDYAQTGVRPVARSAWWSVGTCVLLLLGSIALKWRQRG